MLHHPGAVSRRPARVRQARTLVTATVCALLATACSGKPASSDSRGASGGLSVSYEAPGRGGADERAFLRDRKLPEKVAEDLNGALRLSKRIEIVGRSCRGDNYPEYDPDTGRIVLCYDYIADVRSAFEDAKAPDPDRQTAGVVTESLYHEAAHGLIHQLELAFTGHEEDVADQFAAYRMIPQGAGGRAALLAAADNYAQEAEDGDPEDYDPSDEHAPDAVRAANYRCYLYGAAPTDRRSKELVDGTLLSDERAEQCRDEYRDLRRGWDRLLAPHTA